MYKANDAPRFQQLTAVFLDRLLKAFGVRTVADDESVDEFWIAHRHPPGDSASPVVRHQNARLVTYRNMINQSINQYLFVKSSSIPLYSLIIMCSFVC